MSVPIHVRNGEEAPEELVAREVLCGLGACVTRLAPPGPDYRAVWPDCTDVTVEVTTVPWPGERKFFNTHNNPSHGYLFGCLRYDWPLLVVDDLAGEDPTVPPRNVRDFLAEQVVCVLADAEASTASPADAKRQADACLDILNPGGFLDVGWGVWVLKTPVLGIGRVTVSPSTQVGLADGTDRLCRAIRDAIRHKTAKRQGADCLMVAVTDGVAAEQLAALRVGGSAAADEVHGALNEHLCTSPFDEVWAFTAPAAGDRQRILRLTRLRARVCGPGDAVSCGLTAPPKGS